MDWGRKWLVDFNAGKARLVQFDQSNNTGAIDVKMDVFVLQEKSLFKMLVLTLSSKSDQDSCIISIAKSVSQKIGTLIRSMKFPSPEVAIYLSKSTICLCVEYCRNIWADAPSYWNCQINSKNGQARLSVLHLLPLLNSLLIVKMQPA